MFVLIVKGVWHAGKGEQLKSNRLAQMRSALGVRTCGPPSALFSFFSLHQHPVY